MSGAARKHRQESGFTWVVAIIGIALLALLAGLVVPVANGGPADPRARRIVGLVGVLEQAVRRYHEHTQSFATEYSGPVYDRPRYHQLASRQPQAGWRGPYVDHLLTTQDNPFGGFVYVYGDLTGGAARPHGFGRLADAAGIRAAGQFVAFGRIPPAVARQVEEALDGRATGDWRTTGRVEYDGHAGGILMVLLLRID